MGMVVLAHHLESHQRVAIKFLLPQALASQEAVARFAREARASVKIKNEHVARTLDVGNSRTALPARRWKHVRPVNEDPLRFPCRCQRVPYVINVIICDRG